MIIKKKGGYLYNRWSPAEVLLSNNIVFLQRVVNIKRDKEGGTGCCVGSTWVFEILLLPLFFLIFSLLVAFCYVIITKGGVHCRGET